MMPHVLFFFSIVFVDLDHKHKVKN
jgi:hypothetical protein